MDWKYFFLNLIAAAVALSIILTTVDWLFPEVLP